MRTRRASSWDRLILSDDPDAKKALRRRLLAGEPRPGVTLPRNAKEWQTGLGNLLMVFAALLFAASAPLAFGVVEQSWPEANAAGTLVFSACLLGWMLFVAAGGLEPTRESQALRRRRVRTAALHAPSEDLPAMRAARAAHWRGRLRTMRGQLSASAHFVLAPGVVPLLLYAPICMIMAIKVARQLTGASLAQPGALPGYVVLGFFGAVVVVFVKGSRAVSRLLASLDGPACPDCGYDLADVAAAESDATGRARELGPKRCPECGAPWPLIPPPAPATAPPRA